MTVLDGSFSKSRNALKVLQALSSRRGPPRGISRDDSFLNAPSWLFYENRYVRNFEFVIGLTTPAVLRAFGAELMNSNSTSATTSRVRSLDELLSPFISRPLDAETLHQFKAYLDLLLKWNAKINLTAVRNAEEIVQRHFGESLFAAGQLQLDAVSTLIDFGSGAGFPGLPIKIVAPHLQVTLIESQQKKATFLREVIRNLHLDNVAVYAGRAEESSLKSQIVTIRAVEKFEAALPIAASMVDAGGKLTLLIGSTQSQIASNALPQFAWSNPVSIPRSRERVVLIGSSPKLT